MRNLTNEELELVSGGDLSVGDIVVGSGNSIGSCNSVSVKDVLNCNSILNDSLNCTGNGTGVLNYSGN